MLRMMMSMPGMPCIYYADEAGQQGEDDPFCRATYPWGHEDKDLIEEIRRINHMRMNSRVLRRGSMKLTVPNEDTIVIRRTMPGQPAYEYALTRR